MRLPRKHRSSQPGLGGPGQQLSLLLRGEPVCREQKSTNGIGCATLPSLASVLVLSASFGGQLIQCLPSVVCVKIVLETVSVGGGWVCLQMKAGQP